MDFQQKGYAEPHWSDAESISRPLGQNGRMRKFPRRKHASENEFIHRVLEETKAAGYKLDLRPVKYLLPMKMVGAFCSVDKKITMAMKDVHWFQCLIHEFAHFHQSLENKWISKREESYFDLFPKWIDGSIELSKYKLLKTVRTIQECELDAETRALGFLDKYKFESLCYETYAASANVYLMEHEAARRTRKWPKTSIFDSNILDVVPNTLISRLDIIPDKFLDIYISKC